MLIADEIRRLCDQRQLFELKPLDWRAPIKRSIYVSPDLNCFLTQASASNQANQDRRRLQALFDRFISGETIVIAFQQHINGTDMKRLTPREAEVWEFKITKGPQLRIFARFAL